MRASQWLLGLATTSAILGAVAAGCGGSPTSGTPVKEAGADVSADVAQEAATPEAATDSGAACDVTANLTSLAVPDASIGDSGASTDGCYACIQSTCSTQLSACNADCTCKTDVVTLLECLGTGGSVISCGETLYATSGSDTAAIALLTCLAGPALGGSGAGCLTPCGYSLAEGGVLPTDAAADAPAE